jgi:hypothetical protein
MPSILRLGVSALSHPATVSLQFGGLHGLKDFGKYISEL